MICRMCNWCLDYFKSQTLSSYDLRRHTQLLHEVQFLQPWQLTQLSLPSWSGIVVSWRGISGDFLTKEQDGLDDEVTSFGTRPHWYQGWTVTSRIYSMFCICHCSFHHTSLQLRAASHVSQTKTCTWLECQRTKIVLNLTVPPSNR